MSGATEQVEWQLKGAGNANLVFSYAGKDPALAGFVLRVRRQMSLPDQPAPSTLRATSNASMAPLLDSELWEGILPDMPEDGDSSAREEHYACEYLTRWIDSKYIPRGVACATPEGLLQKLQTKNIPLDTSVPTQLHLDHTLLTHGAPEGWRGTGPTVCVEIKPKSGCMPPTTYCPNMDYVALKSQYPRYVLHALLKAVKGKGELYGYSPLDLFSGDSTRVSAALEALLAAPNNNLRIFVDGELAWGASAKHKAPTAKADKHDSPTHTTHTTTAKAPTATAQPKQPQLLSQETVVDRLKDLDGRLRAAQFASQTGGAGAGSHGSGVDKERLRYVSVLQSVLTSVLSTEGLLKQILAVQKEDTIDVDGAMCVLSALDPSLAKPQQPATPANGGTHSSGTAALSSLDRTALMSLLRGYLTAATTKDCGIMITLQQVERLEPTPANNSTDTDTDDPPHTSNDGSSANAALPPARKVYRKLLSLQRQAVGVSKCGGGAGQEGDVDAAGMHFMYKITLLDLDLKSTGKIPVHAELDREILECALQHRDLLAQLPHVTTKQ